MLKISLHICQHCGSQMEQERLAIALKVMMQMNLRNQNREKNFIRKKKKFTCATGDIKAHGLLVGPKGLKEWKHTHWEEPIT